MSLHRTVCWMRSSTWLAMASCLPELRCHQRCGYSVGIHTNLKKSIFFMTRQGRSDKAMINSFKNVILIYSTMQKLSNTSGSDFTAKVIRFMLFQYLGLIYLWLEHNMESSCQEGKYLKHGFSYRLLVKRMEYRLILL